MAKAVTDIKGGKIEFRVDKNGNLHFIIGKASFTPNALLENYAAALDEVIRLKPAAAKGRYLRKVTFTTSMGPGIPVDPNQTRNLTAELAEAPRPDPAGSSRGLAAGASPRKLATPKTAGCRRARAAAEGWAAPRSPISRSWPGHPAQVN